jgi:iron complex transport system ATP-binding protein
MKSLVASGVQVHFGNRTVLGGASLTLRRGRFVLLAGRNGAGKSTLLRALVGALVPDAGVVLVDERPLAAMPALERARGLAFVPQAIETPFEFTGREIVRMGRYPHHARDEDLGSTDLEAMTRAIDAVDAAAFLDRSVPTLSGGEQRRIAIARALATESAFLLLDEPTANLDLEHALQLVALLRRLANAGTGVLVASHDLNLFAPHCDEVALLHEGRMHTVGAPAAALAATHVRTVFGVSTEPASGPFPRAFRL